MPKAATKPKTYPFTLRLTEAQRATITRKAGDMPLGENIRSTALNEPAVSIPLSSDQVKLGASWVLGGLGQSGVCDDLNAIAKASQQGLVILSPEESVVVVQACADIAAIRRKLMRLRGHRKAANDH